MVSPIDGWKLQRQGAKLDNLANEINKKEVKGEDFKADLKIYEDGLKAFAEELKYFNKKLAGRQAMLGGIAVTQILQNIEVELINVKEKEKLIQ